MRKYIEIEPYKQLLTFYGSIKKKSYTLTPTTLNNITYNEISSKISMVAMRQQPQFNWKMIKPSNHY